MEDVWFNGVLCGSIVYDEVAFICLKFARVNVQCFCSLDWSSCLDFDWFLCNCGEVHVCDFVGLVYVFGFVTCNLVWYAVAVGYC